MRACSTYFLNKDSLPIVIENQSRWSKTQFLEEIQSHQGELKKLLSRYGAILFRGFPLENADDFKSAISSLGLGRFVDYIGGDSPRNKLNEAVYTSTEAPPSIKIPLHNELSFVKHYPKNIYFFCDTPPQSKGETILADARKVYEAIDERVKQLFIAKQLRYVSCYYFKSKVMEFINKIQPSHKSWRQVFETDCKEEVERKCRECEFEYQWKKNDWIEISQLRPAVMDHPETGEKTWFNQAHLYDFNPKLLGKSRYIGAKLFYFRPHTRLHQVFYGDETPISRQDLYHVLDVLDAKTVAFPWKRGDFLALDNVLTMHGRETFSGKRRILTAMTS